MDAYTARCPWTSDELRVDGVIIDDVRDGKIRGKGEWAPRQPPDPRTNHTSTMPDPFNKSLFRIAKMDCPSEEQLIRTAIAPVSADARLQFDIPGRELTIWHREPVSAFEEALATLDLGSSLESSEAVTDASEVPASESAAQSSVLRTLLVVNASMFVVEVVLGIVGQSAGLLSDGLDMLADALVYGVALWAVGRAATHQATAARLSGILQLVLALGVLGEVARRAIVGSSPEPPIMLGTAALALAANVYCLAALTKHRDGGVHMRASWIFSANDVIANLGVIAAGGLVYATSSRIPDLVIGTLIGLVVLRGAVRILKLANANQRASASSSRAAE